MIKYIKYIFSLWLIWLSFYNHVSGYFFGIKSSDNTISNIQQIEDKYKINFPVVSFIFDGVSTATAWVLENLASTLGTGRVYHIALSPEVTTYDINRWNYDSLYSGFFWLLKKHDLKVIFRTMHEMNGWRYHRSGDPIDYKKARNRIWSLSRKVWLDKKNILFDFSVNHMDLPAYDNIPSQYTNYTRCTPEKKKNTWCYTLEDYRPGNWVVDVVWFSMYNRGKGWDDRIWMKPEQIIYERPRDLLTRLWNYNKPIIIDEVGTTSAKYAGSYDRNKTISSYQTDYESKNERLRQFKQALEDNKNIKWAVYFNVDYTMWHQYELRGESDRAVLDVRMDKTYYDIFPLIYSGRLDKMELGFVESGVVYKQDPLLFARKRKILNIPSKSWIKPGPEISGWHTSPINKSIFDF